MTRCARCNRETKAPVPLAGLLLGPSCARAVVGFVVQQSQRRDEKPAEPDPRQMRLLEAA